MKRRCIIAFLVLIFSVFVYQIARTDLVKIIGVGQIRDRVFDNLFQVPITTEHSHTDFVEPLIFEAVWHIGVENWTDTNGDTHPFKITGNSLVKFDELFTIPIPDDDGITLRQFWRYPPPKITVDGRGLDAPFPLAGDSVNPDKIPGTADVMLESTINTDLGITVRQKVLSWSQKNHDDYIIYDWTFINTGNVDIDDEIELPNQVIENFYFHRYTTPDVTSNKMLTAYGEFPTDTLRMQIAYPTRNESAEFDDFGAPDLQSGFIRFPEFIGDVTIHVDKSVDDRSDDPSQPQMTGAQDCDVPWLIQFPPELPLSDQAMMWRAIKEGFNWFDGTPRMEGTWPGTFHDQRVDEQGWKFRDNIPWLANCGSMHQSSGAFNIPFGDSIRIVYANVLGSISREKGWEVGRAWLNGTAADLWEGNFKLPPHYEQFPDLCDNDNDCAKDSWVFTGRDSLFQNAWAAQWAVRNDYNVPIAPSPPSIEVTSLTDRINISWDGTESESASDFAGYRVYRAIGNPDTTFFPIFECGQGTDNALCNSYDDITAQRGFSYYYYVAAFDDGVGNAPGVFGRQESLESGKFLNRTTFGASLTRPGGSLSAARVVPNPFNISARDLQFTGDPNKILFLEVPETATIRIYTESGDLIKTIEHSGSGDASWGILQEEHSATDNGQIVTSGIYIAHIQTPDGDSTILKFVVVR